MTIGLPSEFDLDNPRLSLLFSVVAVYLDNYVNNSGKLKEEDYQKIACASEILRKKSLDFRTGKTSFSENLFFWEFYGKDEKNANSARQSYSDRLLRISEDLSNFKKLPKEEIKRLEGICVKFSEEMRRYGHSMTRPLNSTF